MKIYKFNNNYYRIIINKMNKRKDSYRMFSLRWNLDKPKFDFIEYEYDEKNINDEESVLRSRLNSVQRTKAVVREYAHCNEFNYFVTFTFDSNKIDRYDYNLLKKRITQFFNDFKKRYQHNFKYLIVPEFHRDGAIHFHGLLYIDESELKINSNGYFTWSRYEKRFGFISLSKIVDKEKIANYIAKYITKDVDIIEKYKNRYFCSVGLKKKELLLELPILPNIFEKIDFFESEICFVKDVDYKELFNLLCDYKSDYEKYFSFFDNF